MNDTERLVILNPQNYYKVEDAIGEIWVWESKEDFDRDCDNRYCIARFTASEAREYGLVADDWF